MHINPQGSTSVRRDPSLVAAALGRAVHFDFKAIRERFVDDYSSDAPNVLRIEREFIRYMALVSVYDNESFPMGGAVDNYWHTFLLFTRKYAEFCSLMAGKFVHHEPETKDADPPSIKAATISGFVEYYVTCFGEWPPEDLWPFRCYQLIYDPQ